MQILKLEYDATRNVYHVTMSISGATLVDRVIFTVEDEEGGTVNLEESVILNRRPALRIDLKADKLEPERKYVLLVRGICRNGDLCLLATVQANNDPTILVSKEFQHNPNVKPAIDFAIQSVNADYARDKIIILLRVTNAQDVNKYSGFIRDESGQAVVNIPETLFQGPRIELDIPQVMKIYGVIRQYTILLALTNKSEETVEHEFENFKPVAPKEPEWYEKIIPALIEYPIISVAILGLIFLLTMILILRMERRSRPITIPSLQRPPIDPPTSSDVVMSRLRFAVLQSPGPSKGMERTLVRFPCVIGRSKECDIEIKGDLLVSGRHAQITLRNNTFFIEDLGSKNGTFVGEERIISPRSVSVPGKLRVRLGHDTVCELQTL